ncbi:lysine--tRNA ligase [Candidatus Nomurabacteria bacterium CG_4_9_14_0_2_um_filter_32_10]|uniref:Lysine--tRNA ligase n=3 Tax=Candidatus Nomuraibacteriota TaxID=1752729 RepID=A0A2H0CGQ3_9BACT|nr:MAG: lysine--tRNA ligase [Candidatus Nomurabacteria bacterium CG22_combo_CG10-13_8_21_14_all_32_8]PIZ85545.1 MAG: lysine--tRNA ligase [Candidatus Nomurabacteria bacterium CG_4_10_14_0_2_um_filter_33_9]PJC49632.1 MAG: lysine--tRNA ligase [Candidatus Nomurabacteria bacterium CG_4_9_14_0_2_um_filter_32_10]
MSSIDEIRDTRIKKLKILKDKGINSYPAESKRELSLKEAAEKFDNLTKTGETKWISGRVMSIRGQGAIVFVTLNDGTGLFQGLLKKDVIGDEKFDFFNEVVDIGDFIEISGSFFSTKRGEKTVETKDWVMLSKSLLPLPEKWHGLQDIEERFRKRYLDILMDEEVKELLLKKTKFWDSARSFMKEHGFLEVETPSLEVTASGADAMPFKTYNENFKLPLYLRICIGELWQKRLMSAGFPKTFEIGRAYRNEGTDANHLQEFTNLEFYWAYANYEDGMKLVEEMYKKIAMDVFGKTEFETRGHKFDLGGEWKKIDYRETVKKETGIDVLDTTYDEVKKKLEDLKIVYDGDTMERLVDTLWKYCRKQISGPVFLTGHPKLVSPLSKSMKKNPELTERFQIIIAGTEIGNGFSELNDPIDQAERFEVQKELLKKGDKEAMMPDYEFVEMLEYGMPPTCGFGFGEMLFAFLADKPIRETQLFPLMRPRKE